MENISKKKIWISVTFILHFIAYFLLSSLMINNMLEFQRIVQKVDSNYIPIQYNHIYMSIFYFILSIYLVLLNLKFKISKKAHFIICIIAITFFFISLYKYYTINGFSEMTLVVSGLLVSLNTICRKITS